MLHPYLNKEIGHSKNGALAASKCCISALRNKWVADRKIRRFAVPPNMTCCTPTDLQGMFAQVLISPHSLGSQRLQFARDLIQRDRLGTGEQNYHLLQQHRATKKQLQELNLVWTPCELIEHNLLHTRLHAFDRTDPLPEFGIELVPGIDFTRVIIVVGVIIGLQN